MRSLKRSLAGREFVGLFFFGLDREGESSFLWFTNRKLFDDEYLR